MTKTYGQTVANADIDLDVGEGSIHAILGENGAGKSTLMKLIYGVEAPDAGEMLWKGQTVRLSSPGDARRLGIGMVFQHFSLFETLTVAENIALIVPGPVAALAARIRRFGQEFGLTVDPFAPVHALSVGERQRVEIIRCLMTEPRLLILDEPTSVLPPQAVELLFDTLRRLRDRGVSILFISHKLDEIQSLCDRATILRAGQVTGHVDPRNHDASELARLMIGHSMPPKLHAQARAPGKVMLELSALDHEPDDPFAIPLRGVTLRLHAGEILGIAGVSGNGQANLARLVSGETRLPASRRDGIRIAGEPAAHLDPVRRRALGLAFVPEDRLGRGAVPEMTLADNSLLTAHPLGMLKRGFIDRATEAAFTASCIRDFDVRTSGPDAEAGSLSGGNLQKFIIGREISLNPRLLFVAQPTWGVDIGAATAIRQRLVQMRNEGVAVLVISEELEELFEICDRLQVLHKGTLSPSLDASTTKAEDIGRYMIGASGVAA